MSEVMLTLAERIRRFIEKMPSDRLIQAFDILPNIGVSAGDSGKVEEVIKILVQLAREGVLDDVLVIYDSKFRLVYYTIPNRDVGSFDRYMQIRRGEDPTVGAPKFQTYFVKPAFNETSKVLKAIKEIQPESFS